ncbi:MAG: hypothetical protein U0326_12310 [Polyangiales bacterium]
MVAEDVLGMTLARDLCDRVVIERGPGWLADLWHDVVTRDSQRQWSGLDASTGYVTWGRDEGTRRCVSGCARTGSAYRVAPSRAYRTAHAAAMLTPRPDVLVMCRDTDRTPGLRADAHRCGACARGREDIPMLLAVARPESEAWVIGGRPLHCNEREARVTLARTLGFDPVEGRTR